MTEQGDRNQIQLPPDLSKPAVGRLSLYYRELQRLNETSLGSINSKQLAALVDVSPAVVRRDLSALGAHGRRGVGYEITGLIDDIGATLGSGMQWKVALIGVGSLGHALLRYRGFEKLGFELTSAFDIAPEKIGTTVAGLLIQSIGDLEETMRKSPADLVMLAVPVAFAGEIAAIVVRAGVRGILNFAPTTLRLGDEVAVINVDLASELQRLTFTVQAKT